MSICVCMWQATGFTRAFTKPLGAFLKGPYSRTFTKPLTKGFCKSLSSEGLFHSSYNKGLSAKPLLALGFHKGPIANGFCESHCNKDFHETLLVKHSCIHSKKPKCPYVCMYVAARGFTRGLSGAFSKTISTEKPSSESPSRHYATYKGPLWCPSLVKALLAKATLAKGFHNCPYSKVPPCL